MTENRSELRANVIETLLSTFPNAQRVIGGVAYISDILDEETGKYFPVEIKVSVKNTADTAKSAAYDLDAAVAEFVNKPGRRTADPEKAAALAAQKAESAARKEKYLKIVRDWAETHTVNHMTATDVRNAIPALGEVLVMYVGNLLKTMVDNGELTVETDEKHKKYYTK